MLTCLFDLKNEVTLLPLGKDLNRYFTKEDIKMANKHVKMCDIRQQRNVD